jgi:hypothetical protein
MFYFFAKIRKEIYWLEEVKKDRTKPPVCLFIFETMAKNNFVLNHKAQAYEK